MEILQGKTAVVTGAASGIGHAIAVRLASEGMRLVLADVDDDALAGVVAEIGGERAAGKVTDVSDPQAVERLAGFARSTFGAVHLLVNNAGVHAAGPAWSVTTGDWRWVLDVCLWGVINGVTAFLPAMVDHGQAAHVVNTASMMGFLTAPKGAPYQVAKHGVVALSESLLFDLEDHAPQIGVSVLCPAYTRTRIGTSARVRSKRYGPQTSAVTHSGSSPGASHIEFDDPSDIADRMVEGVKADQFYVFAGGPGWPTAMRRRFDRVIAAERPVRSDIDG